MYFFVKRCSHVNMFRSCKGWCPETTMPMVQDVLGSGSWQGRTGANRMLWQMIHVYYCILCIIIIWDSFIQICMHSTVLAQNILHILLFSFPIFKQHVVLSRLSHRIPNPRFEIRPCLSSEGDSVLRANLWLERATSGESQPFSPIWNGVSRSRPKVPLWR